MNFKQVKRHRASCQPTPLQTIKLSDLICSAILIVFYIKKNRLWWHDSCALNSNNLINLTTLMNYRVKKRIKHRNNLFKSFYFLNQRLSCFTLKSVFVNNKRTIQVLMPTEISVLKLTTYLNNQYIFVWLKSPRFEVLCRISQGWANCQTALTVHYRNSAMVKSITPGKSSF